MGKHYYILLCILLVIPFNEGHAQVCGSNTPTFTADLTGNPDSVWTSPNVVRNDTCCGASSPDVCVKFVVTLDPDAYGIRLDIASGAIPPGALYYQVGCGKKVPVGERICLSSSGPHVVTFCKPGNNSNTYEISSITPPQASSDIIISEACQGTIAAYGFEDTSITWQSVNNNAFHNSFLSCRQDCDTTHVQAQPGYPSYVDYVVCGNPKGACGNITECDTVRVEFVSDLKVDIRPDSPAVCYGNATAEIEAVVTGGKPPYKYNWSMGSNSKKINVGLGSYNVEVTDSTSCPSSNDTVFVDSFSYPITANAGLDTTLCGNFNGVELNGSVLAASGGKWLGGNGSFQPSDSSLSTIYYPTVQEIQNDSLALSLVTTGNKTCEPDTDRVKLYFTSQPKPQINGPGSICFNQSEIYDAAGAGDNQYQWTVNGGTIENRISNDSIRIKWDQNTGQGKITVKATNSSGCDTTINKTIQINPLPDSLILGPDSVCTERSLTYQTIDSPNYQYTWQLGQGTIVNGKGTHRIQARWNTRGTDHLKLKVETPAGCIGKSRKNITINPSPAPLIQGPKSVCAYTIHQYEVNKPQELDFKWQINGGTILSGKGSSNINVAWDDPGQGKLTLIATNQYGCDSTVGYDVQINQAPQTQIEGPDVICAYSRNVSYHTDLNNGNIYNWQITGGEITSSTDSNRIKVKWGDSDTGILTVEEYNPNTGCSKRENIKVNIQPKPTPHLRGVSIVCSDDREMVYSVSENPDHTYFWQVDGGSVVNGSGTNEVKVDWGQVDSGRIEVYVVNKQSRCDSSVSKKVKVFEASAISPKDTSGCEDLTISFEGKSNSSGSKYFWEFGNGVQSNKQNPTVTFEESGHYDVTLRTVSPIGCRDTALTNVTIHQKPNALFEIDYLRNEKFIMAEEDSLVLDNKTQRANYFEWDFGDGTQSLRKEPVHYYSEYGYYTITLAVENKNECKDTTQKEVLVKVPSNVSVPNAFSPNGNGINDYFRIGTYNISDFQVFIFNRWGEIIFRSDNEDFAWDGTYEGKKVQDEVYHYVVLAQDENGNKIKKQGSVTILK